MPDVNIAPFNIVMQVGEIWVAPVGTTQPLVNLATPAGPWTLLGTAGKLDYDTDAVHVIMEHTVEEWMGAGSTMARKAQRTAEAIRATVKLADMSFEALRYALNSNPITTVAAASGIPGSKALPFYQGSVVQTIAACIRGFSPYSGDTNSFSQVEIPNAYNAAGWDIGMLKGATPWAYTLDLRGMIDPANQSSALRAGRWIAYTAAALP